MSDETKPTDNFDELKDFASVVALRDFVMFGFLVTFSAENILQSKCSEQQFRSISETANEIIDKFYRTVTEERRRTIDKYYHEKACVLSEVFNRFMEHFPNESQDLRDLLISQFDKYKKKCTNHSDELINSLESKNGQ